MKRFVLFWAVFRSVVCPGVLAAVPGLYAFSWETGILFATLSHEGHALLIIVLGLVSYSTQVTRE